MRKYRLTPSAKSNLIEIWNFTVEAWGEKQAEKYLQEIENKLNPSFRVGIKILHKYSTFHFLIGGYGTTFVQSFLDGLTRVKTYSQGRINFLLSWLRPSTFSYMHHITIFTVQRDCDPILACQLLPQA